MNNPTTPIKPSLKKAKNAFDFLKNAQKKVQIVLPSRQKLSSTESQTLTGLKK